MNDNHLTPKWLIQALEKEFGKFDLDPCASKNKYNHFANKNYYENLNGLYLPWFGKVFVNPPYSQGNIPKWLNKSIEEILKGNCKLVVLLLPSDTSTNWFLDNFCEQHTYYYTTLEPTTNGTEIRYMKRLKFTNSKDSAKFPSMLVILR